MKRRTFLNTTLVGSALLKFKKVLAMESSTPTMIARRHYKDDDKLSIIGFGGMICLNVSESQCAAIVGESVDRGINLFDVAPSYGNGEAEIKLGPALKPYRDGVFLSCKTMHRDAVGAKRELDQSLRRLKTDHFDLYQFHAVTRLEEVERIFAEGGAIETLTTARAEGKIRYIGFSAHSEEAALAMMERFDFDSILFPFNVVCYAQGKFGPKVLERAKAKGVARLALKSLAYSSWPADAEHTHPKCWYQPIVDRELATEALRFTLSEDVTSTLPPGEEDLFRMAVDIAASFTPMSSKEREKLIARIEDVIPLFPLREC